MSTPTPWKKTIDASWDVVQYSRQFWCRVYFRDTCSDAERLALTRISIWSLSRSKTKRISTMPWWPKFGSLCWNAHLARRRWANTKRCTERMRPKRMFTCRSTRKLTGVQRCSQDQGRGVVPHLPIWGYTMWSLPFATIRISSTGLWRLFSLFAARHKQDSVKYVK
jgi:hypothetical protein